MSQALRYAICVALPLLTASIAAIADDLSDCNSDDNKVRIRGCSAVIRQGKLSKTELAIAYSRRSDAHIEAADFNAGIADRAKAHELDPIDAGHKARLSQAHWLRAEQKLRAGESAGALRDYTDAIRIDATNQAALAGRSTIHFQKKELDKAFLDLSAALKLQPDSGEYKSRLAALYDYRAVTKLLKKDDDGALADADEAIRLNASDARYFVTRGIAHQRKDNPPRAVADFTQAIRLDQSRVDAYASRAELHHAAKSYANAIADFDEVIKREPKNATALLRRALAYEDNGNTTLALNDYRAVLTVEASNALAKASVQRLERTPVVTAAAPMSTAVIRPPTDIAPPQAQSGAFTLYKYHDLEGGDLQQIKDLTLSACVAVCEGQSQCRAYSYDKWNRWCFLKTTASTSRFDPKYVSGVARGAGDPTGSTAAIVIERFRKKAFPEGSYETIKRSSFDECESHCLKEDTCVAVSFFKASRQCRVFNDVGEYFSNDHADSAVKRQPAPKN